MLQSLAHVQNVFKGATKYYFAVAISLTCTLSAALFSYFDVLISCCFPDEADGEINSFPKSVLPIRVGKN